MVDEFLFIRKRDNEFLGNVIILEDTGDFKSYTIPRQGNKRARITWRRLDDLPCFDVRDPIVKIYREKESRGKLRKIGDSVW